MSNKRKVAPVKIYTTEYCYYCVRAKNFLDGKGVPYEEISLEDPSVMKRIKEETGWRTVPIIFIGEELVGGSSELLDLDREGRLEEKLYPA